jgi:lysophospholipase L1-like esterase
MKNKYKILSLILFVILLIVGYKENYIPRLKQKIFPDTSLVYFKNKPYYKEKLSKYDIYNKQADIVMLGSSLTDDIDWNELLNRGDVINRGIGAEIIATMLDRMPYVLKVKPKICFVECGINDIDNNIPLTTSIQQLGQVVELLQKDSIKVVLTAVTYLANIAPNYKKRNEKITAFNSELYKLALQKNCVVVNNNTKMSPNNLLRKDLCKYDGLHYLPAAYLLWKEEIEKVLKEKGY